MVMLPSFRNEAEDQKYIPMSAQPYQAFYSLGSNSLDQAKAHKLSSSPAELPRNILSLSQTFSSEGDKGRRQIGLVCAYVILEKSCC